MSSNSKLANNSRSSVTHHELHSYWHSIIEKHRKILSVRSRTGSRAFHFFAMHDTLRYKILRQPSSVVEVPGFFNTSTMSH